MISDLLTGLLSPCWGWGGPRFRVRPCGFGPYEGIGLRCGPGGSVGESLARGGCVVACFAAAVFAFGHRIFGGI